MSTPNFLESHVSQFSAIPFLQQLGFSCLSPEEVAVGLRGRLGNVLLEGVLATQLRRINRILAKLSLTCASAYKLAFASSPNVCRTLLPRHVGPPQVPSCGLPFSNKPVTPLHDAQLGGYFFARALRTTVASHFLRFMRHKLRSVSPVRHKTSFGSSRRLFEPQTP